MLYTIVTVSLFVPSIIFVSAGVMVYLWLVPLAFIPVILLQTLQFFLAAIFSISLAKFIIDVLQERTLHLDRHHVSKLGHILRGAVFILSLVGGVIFFWNIIAFLFGIALIWLGNHNFWQGLGFASITWNMLVQVYVYQMFFR